MRNLLHILSQWIKCHRHCVSLIITIVSPQKLLFKGNTMGQQKTLWISMGLKLIRQTWCLHLEHVCIDAVMALFYPVPFTHKWVKRTRTQVIIHLTEGGLWPSHVHPTIIADPKVLWTAVAFLSHSCLQDTPVLLTKKTTLRLQYLPLHYFSIHSA